MDLVCVAWLKKQSESFLISIMSRWYIHCVASFTAIGGFLFGYDTGIIAGTVITPGFLIQFQPVTAWVQGSVVSSLLAGCLVGAIMSGFMADTFGRKFVIVFSSVFVFIGSIVQARADTLTVMYVGRIIAGIGIGQLTHTVPLYQAEISPPDIRGRLGSIYQLAVTIGLAISFWISYSCLDLDDNNSWRLPLGLQTVPAFILGAGTMFLPVSPRWLIANGRNQECRDTMVRLWAGESYSPMMVREFNAIKDAVDKNHRQNFFSLFQGSLGRRMWLAILLQIYQQLTGISSITYYTPLLFKQLGLEGTSSTLLAQGISGVVAVVFTCPSIFFIDRWGRRKLLIAGGLIMGVCMAVISGLLGSYGLDNNLDSVKNPHICYAAIAMIYVFIATYSVSWAPVGWIYPAEIFPLHLRASALSLCTATYWIVNFGVGLLTPIMIQNISWRLYTVFSVFGVVMALSALVSFPETKDFILEEMDQVFSSAPDVPRFRARQSFDSDFDYIP